MRVRAVVLVSLAIALSASATDLIQNGSFETNGGANSNLLTGWTTVDEAGGSGAWLAQTGTTNPPRPEFAICLANVDGRVSSFVQTIDNGSGDSAIRVQ